MLRLLLLLAACAAPATALPFGFGRRKGEVLASLREMKAEQLAAEASTRRAEAQARVHEGNQLVAREKWDEALAAYRAAVEKDPELASAWFGIGGCEIHRDGGEICEAAYAPRKKYLELAPDGSAAAHAHLGRG